MEISGATSDFGGMHKYGTNDHATLMKEQKLETNGPKRDCPSLSFPERLQVYTTSFSIILSVTVDV